MEYLGIFIFNNFVFILGHFFVIVTKEKYYSKERIIEKYISKDLNLNVSHTPNPIYQKGKQHFAAALWIKNEEAVKILDLRAMISYHHIFFNLEAARVGSYGVEEVPLFFIDDKTSAQIVDLRPDDRKTLLICEISDVVLDNGDKKRAAVMASDPVFTSGDLCLESIFQIKITLQGKLEGELIYKSYFQEDIFYAKPQEDFIIFIDENNKYIIKMPDELRRRGLKNIDYLEVAKSIDER